MRRAFSLFGWTCTGFAACLLAATPALGVEFRGGGRTRGTHRLAALQVDPGEDEIVPSPLDDEMPAEEATEPMAPAVKKKAASPARKPVNQAAPPSMITQSPWDHGVVHEQGGPCSDGYCAECPPAGGACCRNGSWGSIEYLLWWRSARHTPPLVTTSTTSANVATDGELGQADTRILLDSSQFDDHLQPGGRVDIGFWMDPVQSWGIGLRFAVLGDDDLNYLAGSAVNPVLTVPFFNLDPTVNGQDTLVVAHPLDNSTGSIQVTGHNEVNMGDVYFRLVGAKTDRYRVDIIGGYMFSNILDDTTLRTQTSIGPTSVVVRDRFSAKNEYHGGSIGLMSNYDRGPWTVNLLAKVGLTNVTQTVTVDGLTSVNGVPQTLTGLFTQESNIGTITRDRFAAIPEVGANWVYRLGRANLSVGYSAVYWSNTARSGDQMNPLIDPTQTQARPPQRIVSDNYFAHGLNFGMAWGY
jgi:hypothetical protein